MVRGHAKEVAQQKNAAKQAAMKKSGTQKNEGVNKMKGTKICPICKAQVPDRTIAGALQQQASQRYMSAG